MLHVELKSFPFHVERSDLPFDSPLDWETAALEVIRPSYNPYDKLDALVSEYLKVSDYHQYSARKATGRLGPEPESDLAMLVRLLVFARRTYAVTRALASQLPTFVDSIVEYGAGFAPGLLALRPNVSTYYTERFIEYEQPRIALFKQHKLPPPLKKEAQQPIGQPLHLFTYSFYEHANGDAVRGADQLIELLSQTPRSPCLIVEPGDSAHSHFLQEIRDVLFTKQIRAQAPCPHDRPTCSLHQKPKHWCHFRLPHQPGPLEERILAKAGRTPHRLIFSYLLLNAGVEAGPPKSTILAMYPEGRVKLRTVFCTSDGLRQARTLRRHRPAFEYMGGLRPGSNVSIESNMETNNDGIHVVDESQVVLNWAPWHLTSRS